jgi:hypothetical protein
MRSFQNLSEIVSASAFREKTWQTPRRRKGTLLAEKSWGGTATPQEITMKKLVTTSALIFALSTAGALAQSSQGKAGSDNGPTSNSVTTNGSGNAGTSASDGSDTTRRNEMSNEVTTGASGSSHGNSSSEGNVGPGTNNNSGRQPGGR